MCRTIQKHTGILADACDLLTSKCKDFATKIDENHHQLEAMAGNLALAIAIVLAATLGRTNPVLVLDEATAAELAEIGSEAVECATANATALTLAEEEGLDAILPEMEAITEKSSWIDG